MNDEIKEVLEEMISLKDYQNYSIYGKRANEIGKLLLDYITNLQQEKENYKSRKEKVVEYINNCPEYLWANVNTKVLLNILNGKE